ncbi:MAG TPA: hypothetical protein VKT70_01105 [Stellaceae bacterium]|nr:hypothetical protein [Stellaceae bacterium]
MGEGEVLKESLKEAAVHARQSTTRMGAQMRDMAQSMLEDQRARMADQVHGLAEALRRTASHLEHDDRGGLARYADQAAEGIDRLSERLREQRVNEMMEGVRDFARARPPLFIAGAVAAGFLLGRMVVGSRSAPPSRD